MKRNLGQKIWNKSKKIIPNGNMLLSKNADYFLPNKWPAYFKKAKGCYIWDLDNKKYLDMSTMSVGTNLLGYCNKNVDDKVIKAIKNSNMSTLNCPDEYKLAKVLLKINHWASFAKFAKTGGEANTIALRIARSFTKKNNIAFCGYHGWHDWYLSANLNSRLKDNLSTHLFSNLNTSGVNKKLINTAFPFKFNDIDSFKKTLKNNDIGTVIMEIGRTYKADKFFLKFIRNYCNKKKITLIFDECTTGFRENFGGMHLEMKIFPDIVVYGKAIGNGYPITSILAKKKYMSVARDQFISSTFWSDKIGYTAALATISEMKRVKSWKVIKTNSNYLKEKIIDISRKNKIKIIVSEISSILSFKFDYKKNNLVLKTIFIQEMLKEGVLAGTSIYISTEHTKKVLDFYLKKFDKILKNIFSILESKKKLKSYLKGPVCRSGLNRIN